MTDAATSAGATVSIDLNGKTAELPVVMGSEGEPSIDVTKLRAQTGYITLDPGYRNTGSVSSAITYIAPEDGILRYRGYPIEQLCEHCNFIETALLLIEGELPSRADYERFDALLREHAMIHEGVRRLFDGLPSNAHPMAVLSSMINTISCFQPTIMNIDDEESFQTISAMLISKVATVAAAAYKTSIGHPHMYPDPKQEYCQNFLHMMFSVPREKRMPDPDIVKALDQIFILHADHEQNCSTSTVRMVGSSGANLFASCASGVCALWGPLHGGANVAVMNQLEKIHKSGGDVAGYLERCKNKEDLLYGFGHPVYKNYDPRARILKSSADTVLAKLGVNDPLLRIARELEEAALSDDYFVSRNLYPNVDFYSGIIMRAMGIPTAMFTVMFAMGRMPGWIAQWKEVQDQKSRIYRPRQLYTGHTQRDVTPMAQRG
ncbi:MAG: citrate synthase [Planctomycetota bacterium]